LITEPYLHVIALDFSHIFDVVRQSMQFDKMTALPLPDCVFNWLVNFYSCRSLGVKFQSQLFTIRHINVSVVQGSALGPVSFISNSSDLQVTKADNAMVKYANDIYMIVPASNTSTIPLEMADVQAWAKMNNQALNVTKSAEIIMKGKNITNPVTPLLTVDITRVETLKVL